ncbi:Peroxisomal membrane protein 11C [Bienertia sinuspersici]
MLYYPHFCSLINWSGLVKVGSIRTRSRLRFPRYLFTIGELGKLSASMKKLEKDLKGIDKHEKYNDRSLALVKAALDIVVATGLLQLAPKKSIPVS